MAIHTKRLTCPFHNSQRRAEMASHGVVLLIVMIVATLLLISLSAALPRVYQEGQREREEELIFRGSQYGKAVALFHKQFNRYPTSVKELLRTNGIRFLRQEYRDPMDTKGQWRFIHVSASGVLLDSKNQPANNNQNPAGLGQTGSTGSMIGGNPSTGNSSFGNSSFGNSSINNSNSMTGTSSFGNSSFGNSSMNNSNSMMGDSSFGNSSFGNSSMNNSGSMMGGQMGGGPGANPGGGSGQFGPSSSFFGNQNGSGGGGTYIAGVAATSHHGSIKIWQKHTHYDEWEFLGLDMGIFGIQVGAGNSFSSPGMGQQSPQQGSGFSQQPGVFGSPNPSSGFGSQGPSTGFGSPNATSDFGSPTN